MVTGFEERNSAPGINITAGLLWERLPSGKHRYLKKKELIAKVKAEAELRFALDPKQSEGDEPSPKRRRC